MEKRQEVSDISDEAVDSLKKFTDEGLEKISKIVDREIDKLERWKEIIETERNSRMPKL